MQMNRCKGLTVSLLFLYIFLPGKDIYAQQPLIKKGLYLLINVHISKAAGMINDNSITQQDIANEITREWLVEQLPDGSYKLTNQEGGLVLQAKNKKSYTAITQGNWNGNNSQKWNIKFLPNKYIQLQNKKSGYYLSVIKGHIQQAPQFYNNFQTWRLQLIDQ